jgi:hypothetical protein
MLAVQYQVNRTVKAINVRIFNTTGPREVSHVCADFTKRVVEIGKARIPANG